MMSSMTKAAAMVLVGALTTLMARADEEKIAIDKVPKAAMKAVKKKFPDAKITGAAKEVEDGKTTYEVMLTHDGSKYDVGVKEDGTIVGVEKAITVDDLPKAVTAAVKKAHPKSKITSAEELTEGDTTTFEVAVEVNGKSFEMVLSPKGKVIEDGGAEKKEKDEKKD